MAAANDEECVPICEAYNQAPRRPNYTLPAGACDTHAHVFGPAECYPYVTNRSYTPPDARLNAYRHMLRTMGFQRAVLVQPSVYGTDNRCMLDAMSQCQDDEIEWRAVAVVDEGVSDRELERMDALGVRGIRVNLLFRGGVAFDSAARLAERIAPLGWHIQLLIDVSCFPNLVARLGALPVESVVDHMGHVPVEKTPDDPGFQDLLTLVEQGRTWVKLSGPYRLTAMSSPPYLDVDPFATALWAANPARVVFATDWPHPQIPVAVPNDGDLVDDLSRWIPNAKARNRVLVDNPARLYGF